MEHTPLPWAWVKTPTYVKWDIQTGGDELILSFSGPVLEAVGGEGALGAWGSLSISEADAEFIIRAVNSHYKLLEALERLVRAFQDNPNKPRDSKDWAYTINTDVFAEGIPQAHAAIKAAKGDA